MPSSREYLDFVLEQLSPVEGVSFRPMMGEYVIYCAGKVIGGVYDERFLIKPVPAALRLLDERGLTPQWDLPYPGAKEMLAPDPDERELLCRLVQTVADALPSPKAKKSGKPGL